MTIEAMKKTLAAVAAALTLAACSSGGNGGTGPANATSLKDPCTLLTDDQVAKVLDAAPKGHAAQEGATPQVKNCKWETNESIGSLDIWVGQKADYPLADMNGKGWEKIPGLGEQAAYQSGLVIVTAGGLNLQISTVPKMDEKNDKARTKAKGIEATGYILQALGVGGPVREAPKAESTTRAKPSGAADPTETSTPDKTETSEPDDAFETPETQTSEN